MLSEKSYLSLSNLHLIILSSATQMLYRGINFIIEIKYNIIIIFFNMGRGTMKALITGGAGFIGS